MRYQSVMPTLIDTGRAVCYTEGSSLPETCAPLSETFGVVPGSLATKTERDTVTFTGKSRLFWASHVNGEGTTPRYAGFVILSKEKAAKASKALAAPSHSRKSLP